MNTVLREHDGAMVVRWIPGFPKGKGILDAVNSGKAVEFDLKEIETTDQEYMDNWYNQPSPEQAKEAAITAEIVRYDREKARERLGLSAEGG